MTTTVALKPAVACIAQCCCYFRGLASVRVLLVCPRGTWYRGARGSGGRCGLSPLLVNPLLL